MQRLAEAYSQLSRRERFLVLTMALVVVPLAILFLMALPLVEARENARERYSEARALLSWVEQRNAEYALAGVSSAGQSRTVPVATASVAEVERSVEAAGLRHSVRVLEYGDRETVLLSFGNVAFSQVAPFLDTIEPELGYRIEMLRIDAEDRHGVVSVSLELVSAN